MNNDLSLFFDSRETRLNHLSEERRQYFNGLQEKHKEDPEVLDRILASTWMAKRLRKPTKEVYKNFDTYADKIFTEGTSPTQAYDKIVDYYQNLKRPQDSYIPAHNFKFNRTAAATTEKDTRSLFSGALAWAATAGEIPIINSVMKEHPEWAALKTELQALRAPTSANALTYSTGPYTSGRQDRQNHKRIQQINARLQQLEREYIPEVPLLIHNDEYLGLQEKVHLLERNHAYAQAPQAAKKELEAAKSRLSEIEREHEATLDRLPPHIQKLAKSNAYALTQSLRKVALEQYKLAQAADRYWGVDPRYQRTLMGGIAQGVGSLAPTLLASAMGAGVGGIATASVSHLGKTAATASLKKAASKYAAQAATTASLTSMIYAQVEQERMAHEGDTAYNPRHALVGHSINALGQAGLEGLGIERALGKLIKAPPFKVGTAAAKGEYTKSFLKTAAINAIEEGLTEGLQGRFNAIMVQATYNDSEDIIGPRGRKEMLQDMMIGAIIGGGAGGTISATSSIAHKLATRAKQRQELTRILQAQEINRQTKVYKDIAQAASPSPTLALPEALPSAPLTEGEFALIRKNNDDQTLRRISPDEETASLLIHAANGDYAAQKAYNQIVSANMSANTQGVKVGEMTLSYDQSGILTLNKDDGTPLVLNPHIPEERALIYLTQTAAAIKAKNAQVQSQTQPIPDSQDTQQNEPTTPLAQDPLIKDSIEFLEGQNAASAPFELSDTTHTLADHVQTGELLQSQADSILQVYKDLGILASDATPESVTINAESTKQHDSHTGIWGFINRLYQGATPLTVVEENAETYIKQSIENGQLTHADIEAWRAAVDGSPPTAKTKGQRQRSNIEWFSNQAKAYFAGKAKLDSRVPARIRKWLESIKELLGKLTELYRNLVTLDAQGKLPNDLKVALQQATGLKGPEARRAEKQKARSTQDDQAAQTAYDKAAITKATSLKKAYPEELAQALSANYFSTSPEQLDAAKARLAKAEAKLEAARKRAEADDGTPKSRKALDAYNRALAQLEKAQSDHARVLFRYAAQKAIQARKTAASNEATAKARAQQLQQGWQAAQEAFGKRSEDEGRGSTYSIAKARQDYRLKKFLTGKAHIELKGNELDQIKNFNHPDLPQNARLPAKIAKWYEMNGNAIVPVEGIGPVRLDKVAVEDSRSHGNQPHRLLAFSAVPDILRQGRLIDTMPDMHEPKGKFHHVAAPIAIRGVPYIGVVQVRAMPPPRGKTRMYVHQVLLLKQLQHPSGETSASVVPEGKPPTQDAGVAKTIINKILSVKPEDTSPQPQPKAPIISEADTTFSLTGIPQNVEHEIQARAERIQAGKLSEAPSLTQQDLYAEAYREARIAKANSTAPKAHKDNQGILSRALGSVHETLHRLSPEIARKLRRMEFYLAQLNTSLAQDKNNNSYRKHLLARLRQLEQGPQPQNQPQPSLKDDSHPHSTDQYPTLNEPTQAELDADPHGIAHLSKQQLQDELQRLDQATPPSTGHLANIQPFLDAYSTLPTDIRKQLDLALKNSDTTTRDLILQSFQIQDAFAPVAQTLETLHKQLTDAGFELGYLPNYFVRKVSDPDGLFTLFNERGEPLDDSSGLPPTDGPLVQIIDAQEYTLPSFFYTRTREYVDPEMNKFYADSAEALNTYIEEATQLLAAKQFFGKHTVLVKDAPTPQIDYEASVDNLLAELKNKSDTTAHAAQDSRPATSISPLSDEDIQVIRGNLLARFLYRPSSKPIRTWREGIVLTTLGHFGPVITQLEDLAFAAYESGVWNTAIATANAAINRSELKAQSLGLDSKSQTDLYDPSTLNQAVNGVFKATGFEHMDRVGKEAIMNAKLSQLRQQAQLGRFDDKSKRLLDASFTPEERLQVIKDLKAGRNTELTQFAAYSVLANYQPINRSEYPRSYLQSPNGRLFYTLKTFTIRALNTLRREGFDLIHRGIKNGDYAMAARGIKNLAHLMLFMWLGGLSASYLKDWLYGRPTKLSDNALDSLWRIGNMSRWYVYSYRSARKDLREGRVGDAAIEAGGLLMSLFGPPIPYLTEPYKDYRNAHLKPQLTKRGKPTQYAQRGSESLKLIPIVGSPYYWWFGEGARKNAKRRKAQADKDA